MKNTMSDTIFRRFVPKKNGVILPRPNLLSIFIFISLVFLISIFFVWSRIELVNLEYDISRMERNVRDLKQEERCLRLEVASLRSPSRIEQVARNDLGMKLPSPDQIIVVR